MTERESIRRYRSNLQGEVDSAALYRALAAVEPNAQLKEVYSRLAAVEDKHEKLARELGKKLTPQARATEDQTARRMFMLQYVQPGLAGLMDGSVSTLAPLLAATFAPRNTWSTFLVGLALPT